MKFNRQCLFVFLMAAGLLNISCGKEKIRPQTGFVFNTVCSVNLFEYGNAELYKKVFDCITDLDCKFDAHKTQSELSFINCKAGQHPVKVSAEVFELIQKSLETANNTKGLFNPVLGPVINLWGITGPNPRVPSDDEIEEALKLCDYTKVILDSNNSTVFLEMPGMALDLGAAVKGFACDKVAELLVKEKVLGAVLDFGGNVYLLGHKSNGEPWKVGIKDPAAPGGRPVKVIETGADVSVVTSGSYERYVEVDGREYHHIFDYRTGKPACSGVKSVTVVSSSSFMADVLSTTFFVTGSDSPEFEEISLCYKNCFFYVNFLR